jgi:hypothetical protein
MKWVFCGFMCILNPCTSLSKFTKRRKTILKLWVKFIIRDCQKIFKFSYPMGLCAEVGGELWLEGYLQASKQTCKHGKYNGKHGGQECVCVWNTACTRGCFCAHPSCSHIFSSSCSWLVRQTSSCNLFGHANRQTDRQSWLKYMGFFSSSSSSKTTTISYSNVVTSINQSRPT